MRGGLFALLGLTWGLLFRAALQHWASVLLFSLPSASWSEVMPVFSTPAWLWLLAGGVSGLAASVISWPARSWQWSWRPLLAGLAFAGLTAALLTLSARLTPWTEGREAPAAVSLFSGSTVQGGVGAALPVFWLLAALWLTGGSLALLARWVRRPPSSGRIA